MLMMARISGKSPAEYIARNSPEADFIIDFASTRLTNEPNDPASMSSSSNFRILSHEHQPH